MLELRHVFVVALFAVTTSGCQDATAGADVLQYPVPPGWGAPGSDYVVGNKAEVPGDYRIVEWIKRGDTIHDWRELITTEDWRLEFVQEAEGTVAEYVAKQQRAEEDLCPERTRWVVIRKAEGDILYEAWFTPCPALSARYRSQGKHALAKLAETPYYEIARIFEGRSNRFRLAYAAKGQGVSDTERSRWLGWLAEAGIAPR